MNIIKTVRNDLHLTQQQLADELGLSKSAVEHYEYGRREPNNTILKFISAKWGYSIDWLLTGSGQKFICNDNTANSEKNPDPIVAAYESLPEQSKIAVTEFLLNISDIIREKNKNSSAGNSDAKKR